MDIQNSEVVFNNLNEISTAASSTGYMVKGVIDVMTKQNKP